MRIFDLGIDPAQDFATGDRYGTFYTGVTGANGFDRAGSTFGCEPWILVGHVKNEKKSSCE